MRNKKKENNQEMLLHLNQTLIVIWIRKNSTQAVNFGESMSYRKKTIYFTS